MQVDREKEGQNGNKNGVPLPANFPDRSDSADRSPRPHSVTRNPRLLKIFRGSRWIRSTGATQKQVQKLSGTPEGDDPLEGIEKMMLICYTESLLKYDVGDDAYE